jgi:hypothetical protein
LGEPSPTLDHGKNPNENKIKYINITNIACSDQIRLFEFKSNILGLKPTLDRGPRSKFLRTNLDSFEAN